MPQRLSQHRPGLSLRTQLSLWAALATGLSVLLVAAGLYFAVSGLMQRSQQDRALGAANRVEGTLRRQLDDPRDPEAFFTGRIRISSGDLERLSDADGQRSGIELRIVSSDQDTVQVVQTPQFPTGIRADLNQGDYHFNEQLVVVRLLRGTGALLTVVADGRALLEARRAFTRALTVLLPLALLLSLLMGWWVAGRLLRPVKTLEGAARDIGDGEDLRKPLPGAGENDELARLALTLQRSFGKLADSREREQAFLRAAAHDLRSPLAALQARVDSTLAHQRDAQRYRSELMEIGNDITRLSTLANHLLMLARDPAAMGRSPVPLRDLAAEAVDRARELAPLADVDLQAPQAVTVTGDRVLLGQAIWNLTVNAVKHAPEATVKVSVHSLPGGGAEVTVKDDGPGVGPETLARLGEAFYRPDSSRTGDGHGLGLALARRAAELHGGQLLLNSVPGQGFTAVLQLPASARLGGNDISLPSQ